MHYQTATATSVLRDPALLLLTGPPAIAINIVSLVLYWRAQWFLLLGVVFPTAGLRKVEETEA